MPLSLRRTVIRATQTNFTVLAVAVVFDGARFAVDHVLRDDAGRRLLKCQFFYTDGRHWEIIDRCEIESGEPRANSREIIEARWFEPEKLPPEIDETQRRLINLARQAGGEKTFEPLFLN